jgi:hypothetical protein
MVNSPWYKYDSYQGTPFTGCGKTPVSYQGIRFSAIASSSKSNALQGLGSEIRLFRSLLAQDHYFSFDIFIPGNFRLIAATTEACSGFPELLAKASRACAASGIGYFLAPFSTKSDFGSFFLAALVSLAIIDILLSEGLSSDVPKTLA